MTADLQPRRYVDDLCPGGSFRGHEALIWLTITTRARMRSNEIVKESQFWGTLPNRRSQD